MLGTSDWLETTNTYTACGRLASQSGNNHIDTTGGSTTASFTYDGAGNVVRTNSSINAHSVTETIQSTSDLDHTGRVIYDYFKVGTGVDKIISKNVYNHKEQLTTVYQGKTDNGKTGNLEYGQKIDYSYLTNGLLWKINGDNLTGTKTGISSCDTLSPGDPTTTNYDNKDLFYSILHYDDPLGVADSMKNGNIANVEWQVRGRYAQMYAYDYDEYNRLISADYYDKTSGGSWTPSGIYNTLYTYDDRGNFTDLERWGKITSGGCFTNGKIDDMDYTYTSNTNELKKVNDISNATHGFKDGSGAATSYTYDDNGNMVTDDHKDIDTEFNHLDLPTQIVSNGDTIFFTYDANGTMLQKIQSDNGSRTTIDYISGIEYEDGSIDAVYFGSGRVNYDGGSKRYEYYISDHLGNNRLMYSDLNADGIISTPSEIIEEIHYYPFGMAMDGPWMNSNPMKYTYNGTEYEDFLGLDMNLTTFRGLDPALGRWCQIDPKAEWYYGMSPYNSMGNNPVRFTDPNGDAIPLIAIGIAAVGGGIINTASNWGNIDNFWDGLNYFVVGAGGYGTSVVNPAAGAAILTGGNLLTSGLNGSLAESWENGTFGWEVGFTILDGISAGVTGKALNSTFNAAGKLTAAEAKILAKEGLKSTIDEAAGIGSKTIVKESVQSVVVNTARTAAQMKAKDGVRLLLNAPRTIAKHHIFPQEFREWFAKQGINNIDDFTVPVEHWKTHLRGIHGKGLNNMPGRWNQTWREFINMNPKANPNMIFKQAEDMLHRYGLEYLRYGPY